MGELLDRDFQRQLLEDLRDLYPRAADLRRSYGDQDDGRLLVNLSYLSEHGLIDLKATKFLDGNIGLHFATITAKGMDFIAGDGGLSAILGVVTVKLHDDTIRQLLINRVEKADGDPSVKELVVKKIKELPAEALGTITTKGLDGALSQVPNALEFLKGLVGL